VKVVSCGPPLAVYTSSSGFTEPACQSASFPLGWFADNPIIATRHSFTGGEFSFWTDGLSDLAALLNASPLSLMHALLRAKPRDPEPDWLGIAADDIMAARIQLCEKPEALHAIIEESYGTDQEDGINELQKYWRNSILAATYQDEIRPECTCLYDAMLCAREALLNGLRYGCVAGETTRFQISCRVDLGMLRIRVSDPGPGHAFDMAIHRDKSLSDHHRGLMLIQSLCPRVTTLRNGAELIMDFSWKDEPL
jgi:hypothetical protein